MIEKVDYSEFLLEAVPGYRLQKCTIPPGLPSNDRDRNGHDDRDIQVPKTNGSLWCTVFEVNTGDIVAVATFAASRKSVMCDTIDVDANHRRKGIATALYDLSETIFAVSVVPSSIQSPDSKKFWEKRQIVEIQNGAADTI